MNSSVRLAIFLLAGGVLAAVFLCGAAALHAPGDTVIPPLPHPAARLNFEYRAFDTLGLAFLVFSSLIGAILLLRPRRRILGSALEISAALAVCGYLVTGALGMAGGNAFLHNPSALSVAVLVSMFALEILVGACLMLHVFRLRA